MTMSRPITAAQRLSARYHDVDLTDAETAPDPYRAAQQAITAAKGTLRSGWSSGDAEAVIETSRRAAASRRGEDTPAA